MKYTTSLMKGFNTSASVAVVHHRAALRINEAIDKHASLTADTSRSRSEKASIYEVLQNQYDKALSKDLKEFADVMSRNIETLSEAKSKVLNGTPLVTAIQIIASLKTAGVDNLQLTAIARENIEIAQAMYVAPQALTGLSREVAESTVLNHFPELKEMQESVENDMKAFDSLAENASKTVEKIGWDIDKQALAKRFDENSLKGDLPDPVSSESQDSVITE